MAFENRQDFYNSAGLFLAGSAEQFELEQLDVAARAVGPIALANNVVETDIQIVQPDFAPLQEMPRGRLGRKMFGTPDIKANIIASYKPIAEGWTIATETYDADGETPRYSEKVMLSTQGTLAVIRGTQLQKPEDGKLIVPRRLKESPIGFSAEMDALLEERRLIGLMTPQSFYRFGRMLGPQMTVSRVGEALMQFASFAGFEDALSDKLVGDVQIIEEDPDDL